jgi:predicted PolB exonuclease-like 3'-5' exonuclease
MQPTVIVWDLETVPDLAGFAAANDLVGKSDVEVREAIGDKFPKHIYHSIVCIGALIAHWEPDHWAVDAVGAPHVGERTEKQLITGGAEPAARHVQRQQLRSARINEPGITQATSRSPGARRRVLRSPPRRPRPR